MKERDDFVTIASVPLGSWEKLDAARWWCEERWKEQDQKYRARIFVADRQAVFEFPDELSAMKFSLYFR